MSLREQMAGDLKRTVFNVSDFAETMVHTPRGATVRTCIAGIYRKEFKPTDPLNAHFNVTHAGPSFTFASADKTMRAADVLTISQGTAAEEIFYVIAAHTNRTTQITLALLSKDRPEYSQE